MTLYTLIWFDRAAEAPRVGAAGRVFDNAAECTDAIWAVADALDRACHLEMGVAELRELIERAPVASVFATAGAEPEPVAACELRDAMIREEGATPLNVTPPLYDPAAWVHLRRLAAWLES